ncbi:hypothetical protein GCM10018781_02660 [Kitasatospora indigofera]|uniref:Uncharacterized protein n=1 Tax=Kitasatospora indigofera TaxID=67307 RepID=A0A919FBF2_9ACTN|nr:hypothetical protein [Kitasatospora indigofera]GHH59450.1 hypothetical protein GCM10018781_02660 [Kitasatospora indigofera]
MSTSARLLAAAALALTLATAATPALAASPAPYATAVTAAPETPSDPALPAGPHIDRDTPPAGAPVRGAAPAGAALLATDKPGIGWDDWT